MNISFLVKSGCFPKISKQEDDQSDDDRRARKPSDQRRHEVAAIPRLVPKPTSRNAIANAKIAAASIAAQAAYAPSAKAGAVAVALMWSDGGLSETMVIFLILGGGFSPARQS